MQPFIEFLSNNMIMSTVWVGLFVALIALTIKQKTAAYNVLSPNQATALINHEDGTFLDIRSRDDYKNGHITGSLHILPSEIKANNFGELEKFKQNPIVLVCKSGQTTPEYANLLVKAGFEKVSILKDGLISWNEANLPLVRKKKKK
ncbi:rhodanese-like domain-containing protein [Veronia nyctiphanis]|uniref:Rhodanese-like domain-containing protein n=1 Tax=Veronia nyctiphanis TaxID=1278244 RepID=A0A4Q0YQZ0_9GAMM|nr:rhodanese-like domain-containing protein [Veronia nyctiphanis]RXJ73492.1 rhodanese-like domain-containing protein [Veronia nyctiphanis]